MSDGYWSLQCRVTLPVEQRDRLERLCRQRGQEISDVISEIVLAHLEEISEDQLAEPLQSPPEMSLPEQLRQHERELRRLRMRQSTLGSAAPSWLAGYIKDIELEIVDLRQRIAEQSAS